MILDIIGNKNSGTSFQLVPCACELKWDIYTITQKKDLMVQPRIARMTRIMVCAFVQIRVIRGCLNCKHFYNFCYGKSFRMRYFTSNAICYNRNVSSNGICSNPVFRAVRVFRG